MWVVRLTAVLLFAHRDSPCTVQGFQSEQAARVSQRPVEVRAQASMREDLRWDTSAIEPVQQFLGVFLDSVPVALCVGSEQLFPCSLGVHRILLS